MAARSFPREQRGLSPERHGGQTPGPEDQPGGNADPGSPFPFQHRSARLDSGGPAGHSSTAQWPPMDACLARSPSLPEASRCPSRPGWEPPLTPPRPCPPEEHLARLVPRAPAEAPACPPDPREGRHKAAPAAPGSRAALSSAQARGTGTGTHLGRPITSSPGSPGRPGLAPSPQPVRRQPRTRGGIESLHSAILRPSGQRWPAACSRAHAQGSRTYTRSAHALAKGGADQEEEFGGKMGLQHLDGAEEAGESHAGASREKGQGQPQASRRGSDTRLRLQARGPRATRAAKAQS